jgi:sulfite reductase alpha subunit-like flavoprotein
LQDDKRYVQHLIEEDSADIYRKLIVEEGYFYISG